MSFETIRLGLFNAHQGYQVITQIWQAVKPHLIAGHRLHIEVRAEKRTDAQNRRLWAMLGEVADQVEWHGRRMSAEEWKHVFTAALKRQDVVPNLDGTGFVVLGSKTSQMTKREMSDLQELISAFGAERGVKFSAPEYAEP